MFSKHTCRSLALQVLFLWDAQQSADEILAEQALQSLNNDAAGRAAALQMARDAWKNHAISDQWVERLAPQWPPRRQPGVDRGILRLAVWELTSTDTPPKVVLDEAIELAKEYSTENSPAFVNGVLDAVLREHEKLIAGSTQPTAGSEEKEAPISPEPPTP